MARNWQNVRAQAVRQGDLDEHRIAAARKTMEDGVRAYRLAEIRKAQGVTQASVAAVMHVSQVRVSAIERGELGRAELGTLQSYVEALGGRLRVVADFADQTITVE